MPDGRRVVVTYKPRSGPRRRVTYQPDTGQEGLAHNYWRIEEVYSTAESQWRETGREHVTDPDVVVNSAGTDDADVNSDTMEVHR